MEENNQFVNNVVQPTLTTMGEPTSINSVQHVPMGYQPIKPYTFRKLSAKDIPTMLKILKKIEINKFASCFKSEAVLDLMFSEKDNKNLDLITGGAVFLDIAQILISNLADCGEDIFKLLADTSNLSLNEVKELDFDVFTQMIIDFVKKEEFVGFFKAVSRLINMEN